MKLTEHLTLIKSLPTKNHSFTIKKTNWQNESKQFEIDKIFGDNETIVLNRYDLISTFHHNTEEFILKTLMWGYPIKGRGNNIDNLLRKDNFFDLVKILESYRTMELTCSKLDNDIKSIKGLGLSTMSKFLCFMEIRLEAKLTLILDKRIIDILNSGIFDELASLKQIKFPSSTNSYLEYLKILNNFSKEHDVDSEKVEMFIFIFGKHLSPLQGEECYDDFSEPYEPVIKTYKDFLLEAVNNLNCYEQKLFTDTLNLLMNGELKEVNKVFEKGDIYTFEIRHLENSNDINVVKLVDILKRVENTIKKLKLDNNILDDEILGD